MAKRDEQEAEIAAERAAEKAKIDKLLNAPTSLQHLTIVEESYEGSSSSGDRSSDQQSSSSS